MRGDLFPHLPIFPRHPILLIFQLKAVNHQSDQALLTPSGLRPTRWFLRLDDYFCFLTAVAALLVRNATYQENLSHVTYSLK
jgi:hypothetical protein